MKILELSQSILDTDSERIIKNVRELNIYCAEKINDYFDFFKTGSFVWYPKYKKTCNDIDLLIDKKYKKEFKDLLIPYTKLGLPIHIQSINGINAIHSLFLFYLSREKYIPLQVDFIFCEYHNNHNPTLFSIFSHYVSCKDIEFNIKGCFHKMLLNSISHLHGYTFSVIKGLKIDNETYITDVSRIITIMFGDSNYNLDFWSFVGLVESMNKYFTVEQNLFIYNEFLKHIYPEKSKMIEKTIEEDIKVKETVLKYLKENLIGI